MIPVWLVYVIMAGMYLSGWFHGRGTSHWTLRGYSSKRLRAELEQREALR